MQAAASSIRRTNAIDPCRIGFTRSPQGECGDNWEQRRLLSGTYLQNQAAAVAVDPADLAVVVRDQFQGAPSRLRSAIEEILAERVQG